MILFGVVFNADTHTDHKAFTEYISTPDFKWTDFVGSVHQLIDITKT